MARTVMAILFPILKYLLFLVSARICGRKVVIFALPMLGELPYILPLMERLSCSPDYAVVLACCECHESVEQVKVYLKKETLSRLYLTDMRFVDLFGSLANLYITAEQFHPCPSQIYSICIFHGQPSKGITFSRKVLENFDQFFFIGPLHHRALDRFMRHNGPVEYLPEIFEAGFPKTDPLFRNNYDREKVLSGLGLDSALKTVLYAPAFNEYATLRTIGEKLIAAILSIEGVNLIIKLAPDSIRQKDNIYATGGVSWRERLLRFEGQHCRIAGDLDINPYLVAADIMVTDVSGVAWDFHMMGKPVLYYDCPRFYEKLVTNYDGSLTLDECLSDDSINAGRNYGVVVGNLDELKHRIVELLEGDYTSAWSSVNIQSILYNSGRATEMSLAKIEQIASSGSGMRRRHVAGFFRRLSSILRKLFFGWLHKNVDYWLQRYGYRLARTGLGYLDASTTISSAEEAGLSVCEYLESRESNPRKVGRRDRIIDRMLHCGLFGNTNHICEIGAGTGMYLEKIVEIADPEWYEVYETDPEWSAFLRRRYTREGRGQILVRCADGITLKETDTASCDLVHAHGVFVYLPLLQTLEYLKEAARVCKIGGYVVFDCYLDRSFTLENALKWLDSQWRFPVIIPERLLLEYTLGLSLQRVDGFEEIHGATSVDYLVFRKY